MFETNDMKLCRGCLSADRKLTSVSTGDLTMYYSLLAEDRKLDALSIPGIDLCWECVAMLHRTQKFRARVQRAHTILEDSLGLPPGKTTLSSLTIQHKLEYDAILEETKPNDQPLFCKTVVPDTTVDKIVIPTKYKAVVTENDVENAKNSEDVINDNLANTDYKNDIKIRIENMSDDSDYEKFDDSDRRSSSPEITIKKIKPRKNIQDVKISQFSNLKDIKSKSKAKAEYKPIVKPVPIVRTPVIAKLELELQKFMQNAKNVTATKTSKQKNTKTESTENVGSNDTAKLNDVIGEGSAEKDASNHDRKECKTKCKGNKPESDPDFSLEEDEDEDSASNHSKIEDKNDGEKEKIKKQKRYKKIITRYKHIDDVLSCFTKIDVSVDDFKKNLEKDVDEKKPYNCSICGNRFRVARLLTNHAARLHKATHPGQFRKGSFYNPPPTIPESPCLWRCNVCTKMLRIEHIIAHMNEYHRTQYFCNGDGCEWSLKGFWIKEDHAEHWAAIHKQFFCYSCGTRKKNKSSIESHIQEVHLQVPTQQCPHCTRVYVRRRALLQHIQEWHAPTPVERRYCVECDVTFSSVARLQSHFNLKHNEARKKYPCEECDRVLSNRTTYQNHYNLFHTGKTEHCCHICGKYLSKSQALENHLKSHLNIKIPKNKPCPICGRKFQTNRSLNQHIYTHTGERPYQCTRCEAAYTQPYCLRVHLLKRHGVREAVPCVPVKKSTVTQHQL